MPEDQDPQETQEWRDALDSVVDFDGPDRAAFLLKELYEEARRHAVVVPYSANTAYINTIPVDKQPPHPGDLELEHTIRSLNRWNAVAIVLRANKDELGAGRPHRVVPVVGDALRHRLQPLLARPERGDTAATCCSCRATSRPASTRARSSRAG